MVVVGSGPGAEGPNDKRDPSLPADQQAEVAALVATGKPVVVVVVDDRPLAMGSLRHARRRRHAGRPGDGVAAGHRRAARVSPTCCTGR